MQQSKKYLPIKLFQYIPQEIISEDELRNLKSEKKTVEEVLSLIAFKYIPSIKISPDRFSQLQAFEDFCNNFEIPKKWNANDLYNVTKIEELIETLEMLSEMFKKNTRDNIQTFQTQYGYPQSYSFYQNYSGTGPNYSYPMQSMIQTNQQTAVQIGTLSSISWWNIYGRMRDYFYGEGPIENMFRCFSSGVCDIELLRGGLQSLWKKAAGNEKHEATNIIQNLISEIQSNNLYSPLYLPVFIAFLNCSLKMMHIESDRKIILNVIARSFNQLIHNPSIQEIKWWKFLDEQLTYTKYRDQRFNDEEKLFLLCIDLVVETKVKKKI